MQDLRQCDYGRPLGNSWDILTELGNPTNIRPDGRPDGLGPGRSLHQPDAAVILPSATRWPCQLLGITSSEGGRGVVHCESP